MAKSAFNIIDPAATITVSDNTMTITFRYPDADTAQELLQEMLTAYDNGESITFELSKPMQRRRKISTIYPQPDGMQ